LWRFAICQLACEVVIALSYRFHKFKFVPKPGTTAAAAASAYGGDRGTVEHFRVGHPLNNAGVPYSGFLNFFAFSHPLAL